MLLVDVHKLDIILAQSVAFAALEHQIHDIWGILRLQGQDVFILRAAKHLHQGAQVDTKGDVAVAAKGRKGFGFEHHGNEGNVRIIHGLESDARVIAVKIAILD